MASGSPAAELSRTVALSFFLNGLAFASWAGRIPDVRATLGLTSPELGVLLLALSVGSVAALSGSGALIHRFGPRAVVTASSALVGVALVAIAVGASVGESPLAAAVALIVYGVGTGLWDVAMNVEGAEVERAVGRPIMSRFHAAFSLGTVTGAAFAFLGAAATPSLVWHLSAIAVLVGPLGMWCASTFVGETGEADAPSGVGAAWRDRRTVLIGLLVLVLALTEGTANDWLAVALEDGHGASRPVAVLGFAGFVTAMTIGRLIGPYVLEAVGRVTAVAGTMALSLFGVAIVVLAPHPALVAVGIACWGLGASLGFPVGMSAAADDPATAPARVSVVSTIGYTAFLAGPPLLGFLAGEVGTLDALLVLGVLVLLALPLTAALRPPEPTPTRRPVPSGGPPTPKPGP